MADNNWEAGGKNLIPPRALLCLLVTLACLLVTLTSLQSALALPEKFSPTSYVGSADPNTVWELLIGGIVLCSFLVAVAIGIHPATRWPARLVVRIGIDVHSVKLLHADQIHRGEQCATAGSHVQALATPVFDRAQLQRVRFRPAVKRDGRPVRATVPLTYTLY